MRRRDSLTIDRSTQPRSRRGTNRDRLLEVAARLFHAKGYSATSIRDLARALGLETASLYHYMDSKESLLYEIARRCQERLLEAVEAVVRSPRPALDKLRDFVRVHVTWMIQDRDAYAVLLSEMKSLSGRRRQALVRLRDAYEERLMRVLEEGQQQGVVRADVPVRYLRLALLNLLNWTLYWYRPDGPLGPAELAELLTSVFLDGVRPREGSGNTTAQRG